MVSRYPVYAYNFLDNTVPGEGDRERGYWRDVGTIDSYFDANMDLRNVSPMLNLYNHAWPIRSVLLQYPPVKFVFDAEGRCGMAVEQHHRQRRDHLRRTRAQLGRLQQRLRPQLLRHRRVDPHAGRQHRPRRAADAG